jgi:DNA repair protein RecO (recombination protein O)
MPARVSEAFVLRTYPFQEADVIVSFFTRDQGKLRGVARRARRPKSPFGSGLERLSQVRVSYYQKETVELVRLEGCELIETQFGLSSSYAAGVALDFIAEVCDQLLPPAEPSERYYRLMAAVLADLRTSRDAGVWRAVTYLSYWAVRLGGFLPPFAHPLADQIASTPIQQLASEPWPKERAADLRRRLIRLIEDHIERKLITATVLEAL